jgi:hypothetical protein
MDNLGKDIQRGQRAANILADDLVQEAFAHIDAELWRLFKSVTPSDKDDLAYIRQMQYMREKFAAFFNNVVSNGKMASLEVERQSKLKQAMRRIVG